MWFYDKVNLAIYWIGWQGEEKLISRT